MKVGVAFSTKDRTELSVRSVASLLTSGVYLHINDGSRTEAGERFASDCGKYGVNVNVTHNVRGGADAAIVFGLTQLLNSENNYDAIGLCENDVLLHSDWFAPTMALFERGRADGLAVGAVSARCYEDRILLQRDGYAVVHNSGAGMVLFTREAATHVLNECRNAWSIDNRRVFMQLTGLDIGKWWAFSGLAQWLTYDWNFEAILARHGLTSLALVPNMVEMIGQVPPLGDQGLVYANEPVELLRNDDAFKLFVERTQAIRCGDMRMPGEGHGRHQADNGVWTIFPHQIGAMGGKYKGDWRPKWTQGFGPFTWESVNIAEIVFPVSGSCQILVGGGQKGGKVRAVDTVSGYDVMPELPPEGEDTKILQLVVPASVSYREVRLLMSGPGLRFYGLQTQEPQPWFPEIQFDHSKLPVVS